MTYRGRSDGLVVKSDRKKIITFKFTSRHLRDLQGYCVYTLYLFFILFIFFLGSASPQSHLWTSRPCNLQEQFRSFSSMFCCCYLFQLCLLLHNVCHTCATSLTNYASYLSYIYFVANILL